MMLILWILFVPGKTVQLRERSSLWECPTWEVLLYMYKISIALLQKYLLMHVEVPAYISSITPMLVFNDMLLCEAQLSGCVNKNIMFINLTKINVLFGISSNKSDY